MVEIAQAAPGKSPEINLLVPKKTLEHKLQKGHQYRWVLISSFTLTLWSIQRSLFSGNRPGYEQTFRR
jgi:hypothetical protein